MRKRREMREHDRSTSTPEENFKERSFLEVKEEDNNNNLSEKNRNVISSNSNREYIITRVPLPL